MCICICVYVCISLNVRVRVRAFRAQYIEEVMMHAHHEEAKEKQDKQAGVLQPGNLSPPRTPKIDQLRGNSDLLDAHPDTDTSDDLREHMMDPVYWENSLLEQEDI